MELAVIFLASIWIIAITILFDVLLTEKEKKKLRVEFEKRLNEEKLKILREFYYEDGRRIEGAKKNKEKKEDGKSEDV